MDCLVTACELSKYDIVLDVGCGTGAVIDAIHDKVKFVMGMDISKDLIRNAKEYPNVTHRVGDIKCTRYTELFDKVVMRMCLHHVTDYPLMALWSCYDSLVEGGKPGLDHLAHPGRDSQPFLLHPLDRRGQADGVPDLKGAHLPGEAGADGLVYLDDVVGDLAQAVGGVDEALGNLLPGEPASLVLAPD